MKRLNTSGHSGHMIEVKQNDDLISGHVGRTTIDQVGAGTSIDSGTRIIKLE